MSQKVANKADAKSSKDLPAPRQGKALRKDVSLPLARTPLSTVVYFIAGAMTLYLAYYAYLVMQWKTAAGGWWNLTTGQTAPQSTSSSHSSSSSNIPPEKAVPFGAGTEFESKPGSAGELLESRIAELAEQLGISEPAQLASAIKPLVHPTKASAILDAEPEETEVSSGSDEGKTPTLVDILVEDERKKRAIKAQADTPLGWMEAVVGMDEPPTEMPN